MNRTRRLPAKACLVLCSALIAALAGCTTYVTEAPPADVYVMPPPAQLPPPLVAYEPPLPSESPTMVVQTESDFYQPLTPYGRWVVVGAHGRCWTPASVEAGWRPYGNGNWQRTDAGWFWASDEPWAWATYHYGRWDWSVEVGWFWVPQTQWAPAWVTWREGGGYIGWAPLPPSAIIAASGAVEIREPAFESRAFIFVIERRLMEPVRPRTVIVNNTTIINRTVNITKIQVVNRTVVNEGPRPEAVERLSGRRIQSVPVRDLRRKEETAVVARQRSVPPSAEKNVPPSARPQPAPPKATPPHETRPVAQPAEAAKQPQPPARNNQVREAGAQIPATEAARPETARPAVRPPESRPAARPAVTQPQPQPPSTKGPARGTVGQVPAPKSAPPEAGKSTRNQPQRGAGSERIKSETAPAAAKQPAVRPPATERPAAVKQSAPPQPARQVERPVRSPKDKSAVSEQGAPKAKKADDSKKGPGPETAPK